MASNSSLLDCICPVCCDIFTEPVVLLCGHSFCGDCLQEWWRQSRQQTCPVCKETFPMRQPPRNLALRNLSDNLRQERSQTASAAQDELCGLHSEKLKLFCLDDQQPICVVCRDAKKHKEHDCVPIDEASEDHKAKLQVALMHLKTKLGEITREKRNCDQMAAHIQVQAQHTESKIKEDFKKFYQFLKMEEGARINALRNELKEKSESMKLKTVNLTTMISSLSNTIKTVEEELRSNDVSFILNFKSTMERARRTLPNPETSWGSLINVAKHQGNLMFNVWAKMKNIIQYTSVVLDPNTADGLSVISRDLTSATESDKALCLPENPERARSSMVLGSTGFSSGRHLWTVEVSGPFWAVGVATKIKPCDSGKKWGIYRCVCTGVIREITPEDYTKLICEDSFPSKILVQFDNEKLSFYHLDRKTCVRTITCSSTEPVFPYFSRNVKLLPTEISLTSRQPS